METKDHLLKQRKILQAEINKLSAELALIDKSVSDIEAQEWQETLKKLSEKYGTDIREGKEFVVTQEIHEYANERNFCDGYHRSWLIGQKAIIKSLSNYGNGWVVRAECDTGHIVNNSLNAGEYQPVRLMSADTPIPLRLVADALITQL